jgi:hypothetical protein
MCSDDPPTCYHFLRAEEEKRNAASMSDGDQRDFHLTLADIFHERHLMSDVDNMAYDQFSDEVRLLHGEALLKKKLAFGRLPKPRAGQRQLRLTQHLCLVAALIAEFGSDKWERELERLQSSNDP